MDSTFEAARAALSERLSRYNISQTGTIEHDIALTVLRAIREPDPEMVDRGRDIGPDAPYGAHETREKWEAMVDAMLDQAPAVAPRPNLGHSIAVNPPR